MAFFLFGRGVFALLNLDSEQLALIIPFVDRRADIQAFVALQTNQWASEQCGKGLGDLGLSHAGLALHQQRPLQFGEQQQGGRQIGLGHVTRLLETGLELGDGGHNTSGRSGDRRRPFPAQKRLWNL